MRWKASPAMTCWTGGEREDTLFGGTAIDRLYGSVGADLPNGGGEIGFPLLRWRASRNKAQPSYRVATLFTASGSRRKRSSRARLASISSGRGTASETSNRPV